MKQTQKLDGLIKKILKEEMAIQELSPTTKFNAFNKTFHKFMGAMNKGDEIEREKRSSQFTKMLSHIDPLVQKKADKIASMMGSSFRAYVDKDFKNPSEPFDAPNNLVVRLIFRDVSDTTKSHEYDITKDKVKEIDNNLAGALSEPIIRQIAVLIKDIKAKELDFKNVGDIKEQEGNPAEKFFIYDKNVKKTIGKGFKTKEEAKKAIDAVIAMHPELSQRLSISDAGEMKEENEPFNITKRMAELSSEEKNKIKELLKKRNYSPKSEHDKIDSEVTNIIFPEEIKEYDNTQNADPNITNISKTDTQGIQKLQQQKKKFKVYEEEVPEVKPGKDPEGHSLPPANEIAGKLAEITDSLEAITNEPKDPKHASHAEKVKKHVEAAKLALEALTAHEKMLEDKQAQSDEKGAHKTLKGIHKHLGKMVKDEAAKAKIMAKITPQHIIDAKKAKGEIDEEKFAKAMLKHVIKEGNELKKNFSRIDEKVTYNGEDYFPLVSARDFKEKQTYYMKVFDKVIPISIKKINSDQSFIVGGKNGKEFRLSKDHITDILTKSNVREEDELN